MGKICYRIRPMLLLFLLCSCNRTLNPFFNREILIYYNPFETSSDLKGWDGISEENWRSDTHSNGGRFSIWISGGCMFPHSSLKLGPMGFDAEITASCYGKNLSNGGWIELTADETSEHIVISVAEMDWNLLRTDRTILLPANSTLTINMNSGGFVGSSMLVDDLKVVALVK